MSMRIWEVRVRSVNGAERVVRVPSKTGVQAYDAATPLLKPGETILGADEADDDGYQETDVCPPGSQHHPDQPV